MDPNLILKMESLRNSKNPHKTMYFNRCEVNLFIADLDEYEIGVGREGLGTLITKGLYYFKPQNDMFTNWIHYKDIKVEIRGVKDSE